MSKLAEIRSKTAQFLAKYIVLYSGIAVFLFAAGAVISFIAFPDAGMAAFIMITLSGLSSALSDFAANLIAAEQERAEKERDSEQSDLIKEQD